ncbi:barstar family protein [Nocardia mexicana]|uniref:Barstar (Barnase inhibitor) n=1 Tax=Nocardia mexicana TaxID=279262 RepID=A0A370GY02_9NOCA|nr:barstar family protein [Nocardia mexicana]RDI48555.1 barstar (barnase inhibitor) [Nocardia mexicana]
MATFDPDSDLSHDRAFRLMMNTSVTLFWRPQVLNDATDWLEAHGYQVTCLDAARWAADRDLHRDLAAVLGFPDYYGRNLEALNDCMRDVVDQDYGWAPEAAGLVLVFTSFDAFVTRSPRTAQIVLDIMANHSRTAALFGRRLLCLVQSNDPDIRFEPVGATPVMWNDDEWLDSRRRTD